MLDIIKRFSLLFILTHLSLQSGYGEIEFNRDIRPILSDSCFHCHGPDANDRKADLRLDEESEAKRDLGGYSAITPGKPDESELILRILSDDPDEIMPPPEHNYKLTEKQKQTLKNWIKQGANYQIHWSFSPIKKPLVKSKLNPIDHFIDKKLKKTSLTRSPLASPETQLRRVSLDLTGLPPSLEQLDKYLIEVENLGQNQAFSNAVDRLLASPRYGEKMAWQWLEASRYADTDGYQNDGPRTMWRWRDWVINAYNKNMPFDQFTIEQLAGDLLPNPTHEQIIATAFNRNNRYNSESGIPIDEFLLENAVDRVDTTSTVWMGLTFACARCHDHKYDPLSQKEYYQLIDYFNDIDESGRAIKLGNSEPWIKTPLTSQKNKLSQLDHEIAKIEKQLNNHKDSIRQMQQQWEKSIKEPLPILTYGLDHRYNFDSELNKITPHVKKTPLEFTEGIYGKAIQVGKNKTVSLGNIMGLVGNGRFSISFWMNPQQVDKGPILSNETNSTTRNGIFVEFMNGHLRWNINSRWIAGVSTIETVTSFNKNEWKHITLTNDGTQRTKGMSIYINGKKANTKEIRNTHSNTGKSNNKTPMRIGYSKHVGTWSGKIDELRFYTSRTLSAYEAELLAVNKSILELLKIKPSDRNEQQNKVLYTAHLENSLHDNYNKLYLKLQKAKTNRTKYWDSLPTTMITQDLPGGRPSYIRDRGIYDQLGEQVYGNVPQVLPALKKEETNNRLSFAKWLVSDNHPLTARVTVNRYWQLLFGQGFVKTTEDFGSQGEAPSHSELLDWLASTFIESKWNIKSILKTMVMSHTYRQSSSISKQHLIEDPKNILLARAPRLRLHGNSLRDQALFTSELLFEKQGGASVFPYQPAGLWKEISNTSYKTSKGTDLHRRSLYTYWKRTLAPPNMAVLDTADREYCSVKPKFTNTPLQALTLLNDITFVEAAKHLAELMLQKNKTDIEPRITYAFRKLTSRFPTQDEIATLSKAYHKYLNAFKTNPKSAHDLIKLNQKKLTTQHNITDFAATMTLANVLLNLDEATTRE